MFVRLFNKKNQEKDNEDGFFEKTEAYKVYKNCGNLMETRNIYIDKVIGPILVMYNRQLDFPKAYEDAEKMKEKSKAWFGEKDNPLAGFDCGLSAGLVAYSQYCSALYYNFCDLQYVHGLLGLERPVLTDEEICKNIGKSYKERTTLHYALTDDVIDMVCSVIKCISKLADGEQPYVPGMKYDKKYRVLHEVCDVMGCKYYEQIRDAEIAEMRKQKK